MTYPFRIFLSYSHEDSALALLASQALTKIGYIPKWDKNIRPGIAFTEEIKRLIHLSHVFMPLITERSSKRPWVHQETGFATALNIPVLPVAIGSVPGEMVSQLEAVVVNNDLSDFADKISTIDLDHLVKSPQGYLISSVEISDWPERRSELLAKNSRLVSERNEFGRVRQRAALSSFSIPDRDYSNAIWKKRDGNMVRGDFYHNLLREERQELEKHARDQGCDLIIDPDFCLERNGMMATRTRLQILLEFFESMPDDKLRVMLSPQARDGNLTVVGDWFSAESVSPRPGEGHRQTIFTWHPPTVLKIMLKFDEQFNEIAADCSYGISLSKERAIHRIKEILAK
jgi:hypothetical protein